MSWIVKWFKWLVMPTSLSIPASIDAEIWRTTTISYSVIPDNSTNQKIKWSSADTNVVTVDNEWVITWVSMWTTTITWTFYANWVTQTATVNCVPVSVSWVTLSETDITMSPWETFQLEAIIAPEDATNKNVEWSSSNTSVATVSSTWLVTCIADWECIITATTVDWWFTATCNLATWYSINENTLSYFPFEEDFADKKWVRTLTVNDCVIDEWSAKINSQSSYMTLSSTIWWSQLTISVWYYYWWNSTWWWWNTLFARKWWTYHHFLFPATSSSWTVWNAWFYNSNWYPSSRTLKEWEWYHIVVLKDWTNEKIYINNELFLDSNSSWDNNIYPLWIIANYDSWQSQWAQWRMSDLIFEQWVWDTTKISKYFNNSKKRYFWTIRDYNELEYIESSWTQYINTLYKPNSNTTVEFEISWWTETWSHQIFWEDTNWSSWDAWFSIVTDNYSYNWPASSIVHNLRDWAQHTWSLWPTWLYKDLELVDSSRAWQTFTSNVTLTIFCLHRASTFTEYSSYKLHKFKIYESSTLIMDFMPAKRKSDWAIWLYDKTSWIFYPNEWSWGFTAWPKIWVSLDKNKIALITAWDTYQLVATPNPSSVWDEWYSRESSDTTIATVSSTWLVTCVTPGECIIKVTANATWDTDTCSVTDVASITYSYDFTDWTWTDQKLIDDWWLWVNAWYTWVPYDTWYHYWVTMRNWWVDFRDTGTDRDWSFLKKIDVNISDFTTITFKVRWCKNASWWWLYWKFTVNNNWAEYIICWAECSYNSGRSALIWPWNTTLASDGSRYSVDAVLTINLLTWARSGTLNWTSYSWTMSMPTIPSWDKYTGAYFSKWYYWTPTWLYELSITLE